jgi:amino acid transporter
MTEALATAEAADEFCEDCGYEPELKRTLNGFQVFAARYIYAMSRDGRFPAYKLMRRVNPKTRTPIPATCWSVRSASS